MARARNIKPGFFKNEELAELDPLTRILFVGLWCLADREGRLEDRPKRIRAEVLPYDDGSVERMLDDLHRAGFILRYKAGNQDYISICNFTKHQNPHCKEAPSSIPAPDEHSASTVPKPEENEGNPERAGLIPDSGFLIPDSGFPHPDPDVATTQQTETRDVKFQQELFSLLKSNGITSFNQSNPTYLALLKAGATYDEFKYAVFKAVRNNAKSFAYVLKVVANQREDAAKLQLHQGPMPDRPRSIHDERAETIAKLTGANRNERPTANERDITGEAQRVA